MPNQDNLNRELLYLALLPMIVHIQPFLNRVHLVNVLSFFLCEHLINFLSHHIKENDNFTFFSHNRQKPNDHVSAKW